jgi:hypothetical protein
MGIFQRVGQAMYQNAQSASEQGTGSDADEGEAAPTDEVVEGEIVEEGGAS